MQLIYFPNLPDPNLFPRKKWAEISFCFQPDTKIKAFIFSPAQKLNQTEKEDAKHNLLPQKSAKNDPRGAFPRAHTT